MKETYSIALLVSTLDWLTTIKSYGAGEQQQKGIQNCYIRALLTLAVLTEPTPIIN